MLFNSWSYLIFFSVVFIIYWHVIPKKSNYQNTLLLISSILFYGFWNLKFLFMLFIVIGIDYFFGILISRSTGKKSFLFLIICLINNVGILFYFKYFDFLLAQLNLLFESDFNLMYLIPPIGISFYTFHGLSYVIDLYKKKIKPEQNFIRYALFVSYFPLLVAGPIERATHLLPQLKKERKFNYTQGIEGLKLIIYGFFKKVVIADSLSVFVDLTFETYYNYSALSLILAAIGFSIQIYCDFSGYSDIAIGCSKLLGIELLSNFRFPYFATSIRDFWRKWHISLTSWFKDYVYIPLGGNKVSSLLKMRNIFFVFMISAIWHGSKITFLVWGFIHFFFYIFEDIIKYFFNINPAKNITIRLFGRFYTFSVVTIAWIFFRSESILDAVGYFKQIAINSYENPTNFFEETPNLSIIYYVLFFLIIDWTFRKNERALNPYFKGFSILFINLIFFYLLAENKESFIYFQF